MRWCLYLKNNQAWNELILGMEYVGKYRHAWMLLWALAVPSGYEIVAYYLDLLPSLRFSLMQDLMSHAHTQLCNGDGPLILMMKPLGICSEIVIHKMSRPLLQEESSLTMSAASFSPISTALVEAPRIPSMALSPPGRLAQPWGEEPGRQAEAAYKRRLKTMALQSFSFDDEGLLPVAHRRHKFLTKRSWVKNEVVLLK